MSSKSNLSVTKRPHVTDKAVIDYVMARLKTFSHLKLHKILYFVQGYYHAYFGRPILEEDFQAWVHGPVLPSLFKTMKAEVQANMHDEITVNAQRTSEMKAKLSSSLTKEELELIDQVVDGYKKFNGIELEVLTHKQSPWIKARGNSAPSDICKTVITKSSMAKYFRDEQGW